MSARSSSEAGFRLILALGALVAIAIGIWGLVWTEMLHNILGFEVPRRALGITHVFGGVMVSVGVGYALAAAQPQRSRSLLVPLFFVPLVTAGTMISGVARGDIKSGRGIGFALFELAYCLLFFRLYPRVATPDAPSVGDVPPAGGP
jgi:hypothetical protein